ncbi:SRPBCC family protein [Prevotella denticola]|uniref:SRPBCC family protein n=1 Tax=Prevotella denticola TaxID=28129 RepID=UPI003C791626
MTKFESSIKQIPHSQQSVYRMLNDLNNVQRLKDGFPEGSTGNADMDKVKDKLQSLSFDHDSLSVSVDPVGQISMRIIERDEPKTIKFESDNSPLSFNFWIQILPVTETSSKMKLTIDADIPFFAKGMVSKPLQEGIEKIADALAMIPFE